jgi:hypothetical protein
VKNQQLRILATAAQLERFTPYDLAAATGTSSNTVRSVLRRHRELFDVATAVGTKRSRGRPTKRYTVANADALRAQLGEVRDSLDWVAMPSIEATDIERQTARLDVAESSLRQALSTDRDGDRRKLAGVAVETADVLLEHAALPNELVRRALGVKATGEMLGIRDVAPPQRQGALHDVAAAIAAVAERSPITALVLLRALLQVTRQLDQAPPVGVILHADVKPEHLLVTGTDTPWQKWSVEETGESLWSPAWSAPLAEHSALAGVVLRVAAGRFNVGASLSALREWTPKIVMGDASPDLIEQATKEGAMFLPSSLEDISESAVTGIGSALDQRIAGFNVDDDPVMTDLMILSQQRGSLFGMSIDPTAGKPRHGHRGRHAPQEAVTVVRNRAGGH